MTRPSDRVHDVFRDRSAGKIDIPVNAKPLADQFHISRERLGIHQEYDPDAPNDWGGKGKYVDMPNDIRRNAVGAMGDILAKSSFANPGKSENTGSAPCRVGYSSAPYDNRVNPMYKKRQGE